MRRLDWRQLNLVRGRRVSIESPSSPRGFYFEACEAFGALAR